MKHIKLWLAVFCLTCFTDVSRTAVVTASETRRSSHQAQVAGTDVFTNPIVPGDHPDPSIMLVGGTYWTASTSGGWAPEFALYRSNDLHHWSAAGAVFPHTPKWASGDFWAPELVDDRGHIVVYYVARNRSGVLCVAAATASRAEGPYTDHGPMMCQPDGSIDPAFARDKDGQPFLIWKEDGNSQGRPTILWAEALAPDLVHVTGPKTQLLVNDPATWEGGVIEAPFVLQHADRFYLFFAGNACCGTECHYAEGVARANNLLGPWEKDPDNPIIRPNANWRCPGHGSAVETPKGKDYFLYHAYPVNGMVYVGRESVLDPITWDSNGWPVINGGHGPGGGGLAPGKELAQPAFVDNFQHTPLDPEWKWPVGHAPASHIANGRLILDTSSEAQPVFIARSLLSASYVASVGLPREDQASAGLGLIGNFKNLIVVERHENQLELLRTSHGSREMLWTGEVGSAPTIWVRVASTGQARAKFSYSLDEKNWNDAGPDVDLSQLVPWDQGLRIGLVAMGKPGGHSSFVHFVVLPGGET